MFRMPYIVHVHAGGFEGSIRRSRVASLAARRLVADAAVTIVVAERWRRFFEQLGAMRVLALPNGLSASERIALESVRRRPQPASLRPVLLFDGALDSGKGNRPRRRRPPRARRRRIRGPPVWEWRPGLA